MGFRVPQWHVAYSGTVVFSASRRNVSTIFWCRKMFFELKIQLGKVSGFGNATDITYVRIGT